MLITALETQLWGSAPTMSLYGRQPHLPVDVALGLAPQTTTATDKMKFVQKMRECTKWAQKKAETFQVKEAECHKCNYDKCSRAAALEIGGYGSIHVTAFKVITIFRIGGRIGSMLWKSGPIMMYQFRWYAPGMGKGAAVPYIGTICFPSAPT